MCELYVSSKRKKQTIKRRIECSSYHISYISYVLIICSPWFLIFFKSTFIILQGAAGFPGGRGPPGPPGSNVSTF